MANLQTIASSTMEGALLEIIEGLADLQDLSAATENPKTMIDSYTRDGVTGLISVTLSIPSASAEGLNGAPVITAQEVFA